MPSRLLAPIAAEDCVRKHLMNRRVAVRYPGGRRTLGRIVAGRDFHRGRIRDISVGGISLVLRSALKAGTRLLIQLRNKELRMSYDLAARVVHATPQPRGSWSVGCAFARKLTPLELQSLL